MADKNLNKATAIEGSNQTSADRDEPFINKIDNLTNHANQVLNSPRFLQSGDEGVPVAVAEILKSQLIEISKRCSTQIPPCPSAPTLH